MQGKTFFLGKDSTLQLLWQSNGHYIHNDFIERRVKIKAEER